MSGSRSSLIKVGIGKVVSDKARDSFEIKVFPPESLSMVDGDVAGWSGGDGSRAWVNAMWIESSASNRATAPDVSAGEQVDLYKYADTGQFIWKTQKRDSDLRGQETVLFVFKNRAGTGSRSGGVSGSAVATRSSQSGSLMEPNRSFVDDSTGMSSAANISAIKGKARSMDRPASGTIGLKSNWDIDGANKNDSSGYKSLNASIFGTFGPIPVFFDYNPDKSTGFPSSAVDSDGWGLSYNFGYKPPVIVINEQTEYDEWTDTPVYFSDDSSTKTASNKEGVNQDQDADLDGFSGSKKDKYNDLAKDLTGSTGSPVDTSLNDIPVDPVQKDPVERVTYKQTDNTDPEIYKNNNLNRVSGDYYAVAASRIGDTDFEESPPDSVMFHESPTIGRMYRTKDGDSYTLKPDGERVYRPKIYGVTSLSDYKTDMARATPLSLLPDELFLGHLPDSIIGTRYHLHAIGENGITLDLTGLNLPINKAVFWNQYGPKVPGDRSLTMIARGVNIGAPWFSDPGGRVISVLGSALKLMYGTDTAEGVSDADLRIMIERHYSSGTISPKNKSIGSAEIAGTVDPITGIGVFNNGVTEARVSYDYPDRPTHSDNIKKTVIDVPYFPPIANQKKRGMTAILINEKLDAPEVDDKYISGDLSVLLEIEEQ